MPMWAGLLLPNRTHDSSEAVTAWPRPAASYGSATNGGDWLPATQVVVMAPLPKAANVQCNP